jgi:hypothetical protein
MSFQVLRPTLTWIKSAYTYGKDPLTFCIFFFFFLFISYSVTSNLKLSLQIHYLVAKCHQIRKIVSPRCFSTKNYNHLPLLWSGRRDRMVLHVVRKWKWGYWVYIYISIGKPRVNPLLSLEGPGIGRVVTSGLNM